MFVWLKNQRGIEETGRGMMAARAESCPLRPSPPSYESCRGWTQLAGDAKLESFLYFVFFIFASSKMM